MSKKDEALKLALEALLGWGKGFPDNWGDLDTEAITAIREALAEQPAQPLPGRNHWEDGDVFERIGAMKKQPAQQQEPKFWYDEEEGLLHDHFGDVPLGCIPLYTSPPASKPWVGLTEEEVDECYYWKDRQWTTDELVRHVEAKLREKNT